VTQNLCLDAGHVGKGQDAMDGWIRSSHPSQRRRSL
jgi:hypothetical protein